MEKGQGTEKSYFHFLPAECCSAEQLASVYSPAEREQQLLRIQLLLESNSAKRCWFMTAEPKGRTIAFLQLCQEKRRPGRFRIRGLHCRRRFRRQGLATRLLQLGIQNVVEQYRAEEIISFILPTNRSSIRAHERAGFCYCAELPGGILPERHLCLICRTFTGEGKTQCRS